MNYLPEASVLVNLSFKMNFSVNSMDYLGFGGLSYFLINQENSLDSMITEVQSI